MDIKNQACSLEYAKRFKKLGIKQIGHFVYDMYGDIPKLMYSRQCNITKDDIVTFTVAELGGMLPNSIGKYVMTTMRMNKGTWVCGYYLSLIDVLYEIGDKTEANARAKMLIWLIENKYITVEEINKIIKR